MKVATTSLLFVLTGCITAVDGEKASKPISRRKLTKSRKNGKSDKSTKSPGGGKGKGSCMSGDLLIKQPGDASTALKDLGTGDEVLGLDKDLKQATCNIITVDQWGLRPMFGQYTADHFIYDTEDGNIQQHGEVGEETFESTFITISTCPLMLDYKGTAFTSLDTYALGDADTGGSGPFSLEEYVGMWTVQSAFVRIAPEIMSESAYNFTRSDASESLGFYSTIQGAVACTTDVNACPGAFAALQAALLRYNDDVVEKVSALFFQSIDATDKASIQAGLIALLSASNVWPQ